jgi:hypothetical protein
MTRQGVEYDTCAPPTACLPGNNVNNGNNGRQQQRIYEQTNVSTAFAFAVYLRVAGIRPVWRLVFGC